MADFAQTITTAYATDGAALDLGRGVHDGAVVAGATVKLPLRMVNRHGLIAGATGTGKTKTLQGIAEQLSSAGVPVFVADVKGDLSGVAEPGDAGGAAAKRAQELGLQFQARGFPVEFFALGGIGAGIPIRATVSDFGPQLHKDNTRVRLRPSQARHDRDRALRRNQGANHLEAAALCGDAWLVACTPAQVSDEFCKEAGSRVERF